ncbi:hypothetical protein B0H15DRAFT_142799 [Mycena belliarum]|uniref:Uncharacterized protein n=1 Tax=Mycena belliarum TaxID=1033014 RepID=A0AAD6XUG8_9AGAR|nr:hypothetical protein B0H15DRAFT_142799 [Mycena belliae]
MQPAPALAPRAALLPRRVRRPRLRRAALRRAGPAPPLRRVAHRRRQPAHFADAHPLGRPLAAHQACAARQALVLCTHRKAPPRRRRRVPHPRAAPLDVLPARHGRRVRAVPPARRAVRARRARGSAVHVLRLAVLRAVLLLVRLRALWLAEHVRVLLLVRLVLVPHHAAPGRVRVRVGVRGGVGVQRRARRPLRRVVPVAPQPRVPAVIQPRLLVRALLPPSLEIAPPHTAPSVPAQVEARL